MRIAQISLKSNVTAAARPRIGYTLYSVTYTRYDLAAASQRNFRAIGPSLSWNASAALLGEKDDAQLSLDWGINGALLFGQQKVHTAHGTHHQR